MKRGKVAVVLTLDRELVEELNEEAKVRGITLFELIEEILDEWLERAREEDEIASRLYNLLDQLNRKIDRLLSHEDGNEL